MNRIAGRIIMCMLLIVALAVIWNLLFWTLAQPKKDHFSQM